MGEPTRRLIPWGSVLAITVLAVILSLVLRSGPGATVAASWPSVLATVVAAGAAFQSGRWLLNYVCGFVLALLITLHPLFQDAARVAPPPLVAEALHLVALALVLASWRLAFRAEFAWLAWLAVGAGLCLDLGVAWLVQLRVALSASLLALVCVPAVALLVLARRRRPGAVRPSLWNGLAAFLTGLLGPAVGLLLAPLLPEAFASQGAALLGGPINLPAGGALELLQAAVARHEGGLQMPGFSSQELETWCWPLAWVVLLPLVVWGLWRSVRRGWRLWPAGRMPLSWVLPVYAAADLLGMLLQPASVTELRGLPLAPPSLLLAVFCAGDLVRGAIEAVRLPPPHEGEEPGTA